MSEAASLARDRFRDKGWELFVYFCPEYPCKEFNILHLTKNKKGNLPRLLNRVNTKLASFYESEKRAREPKQGKRRKRVNYPKKMSKRYIEMRIAIHTWEGEGGALNPRDLGD